MTTNMNRINISLLSLFLVLTLFSCRKNNIPYTQDGNWVNRSSLDGPTRSEAVVFTVGEFAYVGTGWDGLNTRYNDFWKYDGTANSWTQIKSMPDEAGTRSNAAAFSVHSFGYVGTGYDGFNYLKDFWEYSVDSNGWARKADFPKPARYEAVGFGIGDFGYLGTGYDGSNAQKDFAKYDPASDTWSDLGFSGNKRYSAVTFIYNNKAYLVTGVNSGSMVNDFWVFDPSNTSAPWTELAQISNVNSDPFDDGYTNIVRNNAAAFVMTGTNSGDKAYITTGENGSLYTFTWEYDFATDRWKEKTPFERAARTGAVGFNINNKGFVGLGRTSSGKQGALDDLMEFFPDDVVNSNDNQ